MLEDPTLSTVKSTRSHLSYAIPYRPTSTQSTQTPRISSAGDYNITAEMYNKKRELFAPTKPTLEQQAEDNGGLYASIQTPLNRRQRRPLYSEQVSCGRRSVPHTTYSEDEGVVLHCESESSGSQYAPSDNRVHYDKVANRELRTPPSKDFTYSRYSWDRTLDTTYETLDTSYFDRSVVYKSPVKPHSYRSIGGKSLIRKSIKHDQLKCFA